MSADGNPVLGIMQPDNGSFHALAWPRMGRPRKTVKPKGEIEEKIGRQLTAWINLSLPIRKYANVTRQHEALSRRCGVGQETIRNIANGAQTARIDNLQAITAALGRSLVELFEVVEQELAHGGRTPKGDDDEDPLSGELQPGAD